MGSFTPACTMVTRSGVTFLLVTLLSVSDGRRKFEETSRKCPKYFECVHRSACDYYIQRYTEYKQTNNTEIITELKALICNERKRAVCCRQNSAPTTADPTTSAPTTPPQPNSCGKPQKIPESIINGTKTAPGEFPFSGLIGYQQKKTILLPRGPKNTVVNKWICSAVIISPRFLVTAAHCKKKDLPQFRVALGVLYLSTNLIYPPSLPKVQIFYVNEQDFVIHRDYVRERRNGRLVVKNDIGLMKLPKDAQYNQLTQRICLGPIPANTMGDPVVVGWGKTDPDQLSQNENGVYSNDQLKLKVPEVSLDTCQNSLNTYLDSTQVCAGGELGKDACSGDSGGGLFIRDTSDTWHLLGIVSFGANDCGNGKPGVYTRVSSFLQWISRTRAAME